MPFELGARSRAKLAGVHPKLIAVVERAVAISPVDFSVHDGLRTLEKQRELFKNGNSKTMNSKHLPQDDGLGHAVDLVPWIAQELRWEWPPIYKIAAAVREASLAEQAELIWGGVWDRDMSELPATPEALRQAVHEYCERHPGPDFLDGPHYQLA